ncbi:unnamed protein product [Caenorhabditis nigoni]
MSSGFPILSLPHVVFREISKSWDLFDLIKILDLPSADAKKAVKLTKFEAQNVEVELRKDYSVDVTVWFNGKNYTFNLIETMTEKKVPEFRQISPLKCEIHYPRSQNQVEKICKSILDLCRKSSIDHFQFSRNIYESDFKNFSSIILDAKSVHVSPDSVTEEELDLIFGKFQKLENVSFTTRIPKNYEGLKNRKLKSLQAPCLDWTDVKDLDVERLWLWKTLWTTFEFNSYIKHWLKSPNPCLKEVHVMVMEISNIFDGLTTKVWDPSNRGKYFIREDGWKPTAIDCSLGLDIVREDGLMATVTLEKGHVGFYIWHQRFPEIPKNAVIL